MSDNNTNHGGNDENIIGAIFDRATRVDLMLKAHANQGSEAVGNFVSDTRATTQGEGLQFNTATGKVERQDGSSFNIDDINSDDIDWSQIDLPDNGCHIPAERARLQREVAELELKANAILRYNSQTGEPIYALNGHDRERMLNLAASKKAQMVESFKELDRLQAQRDRRAQLGQAWEVAAAEREARISRMEAEKLEELEAERRARAAFARNKHGGI